MRKILLIFLLMLFSTQIYSQNTIIIQQNSNVHNQGQINEPTINGIPMSADIGGVDMSLIQIEGTPMYFVRLTNYNDFIVNVTFQFNYGHESDKVYSGNFVLQPGAYRETERYYFRPNNCISITRALKRQ